MSIRRAGWSLLLALAAGARADETSAPSELQEQEVKLDLTTGPESNGWKRAVWPLSARYRNHEGWVDLHFMIDKSGKTYEIAVTDSTGGAAFEAAAIKAAKKWKFEPAMFNGEPTEAGYHYRLYFARSYVDSVRPRFFRAYQAAVAATNDGDRPRAEGALQKLIVDNLYEDAFASLAKYQFAAKWGTEAEQIAALRRAVGMAQWAGQLRRSQFVTALHALLRLELRAKDFASALSTWDTLKRLQPDHEAVTELQPTIEDAVALRKDDRAYAVPGEIAAGSSSWFYTLYKHRFQVIVASGHLSEVKLRCDRRYDSFGFDATLYYRIADQYGNCGLELVGDPGTQFELIQS